MAKFYSICYRKKLHWVLGFFRITILYREVYKIASLNEKSWVAREMGDDWKYTGNSEFHVEMQDGYSKMLKFYNNEKSSDLYDEISMELC
jgi:hypothetical protein